MATGIATHERGMASAASQHDESVNVDALEREYASMVSDLRAVFNTGKTTALDWRVTQLKQLKRAMVEMKDDIANAMKVDLGRSRFEALFAEVVGVVSEVDFLIANVADWMKPERVTTPLMMQPSTSEIHPKPRGVVLIISPWNYPINLAVISIAGAIVAGNCVVLKPSENAPESAKVIQKIVDKYLDPEAIKVVQGAVSETTALLRVRFDFIHYTGSGGIGRVVAKAAAEHLTPVSLELGGKSPCFVDDSCSVGVTAKRLMNGKLLNNAQTCIAPDYALVTSKTAEKLLPEIQAYLAKAYGADPKQSKDYGRIINERHFDRIMRLADPSSHGGKIIGQGLDKADRAARYIPPTIVLNPDLDSPLMQEEIFGPILPVITVDNMEQAIKVVNSREHPLALYIFAESQPAIDRILANTTSGGTCVNDCLYHITNPHLPFGGVGTSGTGAYHGKHSFDEFSHFRAVMTRSTWIDPGMRYPPYDDAAIDKVLDFVASEGLSPAAKGALLVAGAGAIGLAMYSKM